MSYTRIYPAGMVPSRPTVRTTLVGGAIMVPAGVPCEITLPMFTSPAARFTYSTSAPRPTAVSFARASASAKPFTLGVATGCGPLETYTVTGTPAFTNVPATGSVRITIPLAMVALASSATVTTNLYGSPCKNVCADAVV